MPKYFYKAIDDNAEQVRGTVTAADANAAAERLRSQGLMVTEIEETDSAAHLGAVGTLAGMFGMVRTKDIVLFFRMFSALIASNVTISEAIDILYEQAENRKLKRVLDRIRLKIEGGEPLSAAMADHPRVFPQVVASMIQAGELGGILDVVLERISDYLESKAALKARLIISMIYPSVVVVVATVVVIFLVTFVIPKFATLMGGRRLPANTQFLLDASAFLTHNARSILVGIVALVGGIAALFAAPASRLIIDRYKIRVPVIGPIIRYGVIVQFAKTLASLLESGITLVDALRATGETMTNAAVRLQVGRMNDLVIAGEPLSMAFEGDRFFTPIVRAMVKIGEHSGLMDQAMVTVGELHEKILQDKIARMSAMIEPVLVVVLGGIVGYVAWGLVAGMLAMYSAVS
ncbi:type II secretion system F family protein [uncultured Desulfosarcina sp.]|uniref:type II secretion system F family protein n=1 Tax=uncultured Desulfosarcina sp. TaxID=218289 RepID=UPI0029C79BDD|nr:type II secretion system F family protein [uncultured Desulfosarcina sp.]